MTQADRQGFRILNRAATWIVSANSHTTYNCLDRQTDTWIALLFGCVVWPVCYASDKKNLLCFKILKLFLALVKLPHNQSDSIIHLTAAAADSVEG